MTIRKIRSSWWNQLLGHEPLSFVLIVLLIEKGLIHEFAKESQFVN